MTEDKQNIGPLLTALGARRVGVDHYTEHDFEMERIGREQNDKVYAKRLETLEAAGWVPFRGPYYYAGREWHGGHHPPGTEKRVPSRVAFAMFREANPDVELEPYKPHPHGWTPPTTTEGMFHMEVTEVKPMEMPAFSLLSYKPPETEKDREQKRWKEFCSQFDGVRSTGWGISRDPEGGPNINYRGVTLEHDGDADKFPDEWEGKVVRVKIKPEAEERAEKEARNKAAKAKYDEEAAWVRKASRGVK